MQANTDRSISDDNNRDLIAAESARHDGHAGSSSFDVSAVAQIARRLQDQVARVIVGKNDVVELLLVALFCEGHVLLEDVPGIGKTTLAKTLARSLGCTFNRIQFTPDLLPSDITGVSIYNQQTNEFEYRPGPIMAQLVLADEINRAGPRTQSALLEAMEERQVTVDGRTRALPYPFLVMATQNPIELEGTFPLPEAQLDRFLMRVALGYPQREEERQILRRFRGESPLSQIEALVSTDDLRVARDLCRQVFVHASMEDYMLDLASLSRSHDEIGLGVSPRGTLALYKTSQALAAIRGRTFVLPDDVQRLITPVFGHRIVLHIDARLHSRSPDQVLDAMVAQVPVPVEETWHRQPSVRN